MCNLPFTYRLNRCMLFFHCYVVECGPAQVLPHVSLHIGFSLAPHFLVNGLHLVGFCLHTNYRESPPCNLAHFGLSHLFPLALV